MIADGTGFHEMDAGNNRAAGMRVKAMGISRLVYSKVGWDACHGASASIVAMQEQAAVFTGIAMAAHQRVTSLDSVHTPSPAIQHVHARAELRRTVYLEAYG